MSDTKQNRQGPGRPKRKVPQRMRFGITCTDAERIAVDKMILEERYKTQNPKLTVADFFLKRIHIR